MFDEFNEGFTDLDNEQCLINYKSFLQEEGHAHLSKEELESEFSPVPMYSGDHEFKAGLKEAMKFKRKNRKHLVITH